MGFLLRTLSLSYLKHHFLKTFLTLVGVTIGVATFASMRSARDTLVGSLRTTIDRLAGNAQLQITGVGGVPEGLQESLRGVAGLKALAPVIEQVVQIDQERLGSVLVLGVDLLGDRDMREYAFEGEDADLDDPLLFLAQPDSIALSRRVADSAGIKKGDALVFRFGDERRTVIVRGLLPATGFAEAFGGRVAVTDVYAAQDMFRRGRRFDHLDVRLEDGVSIAEGTSRLRDAAGLGYRVATPGRRGDDMERLIENFTAGLDVSSVLALCIGVFLVFNTFAVAVNRRRQHIGILRAVGATARQVQALFLLEAVILGTLGGVLGLLVGVGLAGRFLGVVSATVEVTWGMKTASLFRLAPRLVAQCLAIGLLASIVGAWWPARAAARLLPSDALATGRFQGLPPARMAARSLAGVAAIAAAAACGAWPPVTGIGLLVLVLGLGGAGTVLLVGPVATAVLGAAAPLVARLSPVSGRIAADALVGHLRRTSSTTAAVTVSLAFVLGTAAYFESTQAALLRWTDRVNTADVVVQASTTLAPSNVRFAADVGDTIRQVPGVRSVEGYRHDHVEFRDSEVMLVALDGPGIASRVRQEYLEGDEDTFRRGLLERQECAVSDNFSRRFGLGVGDTVELHSPTGVVRLPIAAVVAAFFSDKGAVIVERSLVTARWQDDRVDMFEVNIEPGAHPDAVGHAVQARLAAEGVPALISTRDEFGRQVHQALGSFNTLTRLAVLMALVVAYTGIVTSLLISVAERTRDIGVLRALGAMRFQIRVSVVSEALAMALLGGVLALPLGLLLGRFLEVTVAEAYAGFHLPAAFPTDLILQLCVALPVVSVLAAWLPARQALATTVVEALAYE